MPGNYCSVAVCKNNSNNLKGQKLAFFHFPKDAKMQKEWWDRCARQDPSYINLQNLKICSAHFRTEDFEDMIKAHILGTQPKKLRTDAVPSLKLGQPEREEIKIEVVDSICSEIKMEENENSGTPDFDNVMTDMERKLNESTQKVHELTKLNAQLVQDQDAFIKQLEKKLGESTQKVHDLNQLNAQLAKDQAALVKQLNKLEKDNEKLLDSTCHANLTIQKLQNSRGNFDSKLAEILSPCFSPNQIQVLVKKKSKARWNSDEMSRAFTLRYLSKKAYIYLRETLNYPLPGLSTLRRWACNIDIKSGILSDVLKIMNTSGLNKSDLQKCTVLSFNEMKVNSVYEYDKKVDHMLGPHSYVQIVMARGLFDSWKQPIFVGFDVKITTDLLFDIIKQLHDINFTVCACVSDCSGGNQGLWKELGVDCDSTYFTNPNSPSEKVFLFADVPHLLNLTRNWFLDTGFTVGSKSINKNPIEELVKFSKKEAISSLKLTDDHLFCEGAQRHNVKLAAQLFSHTTSLALRDYQLGDDKELIERTASFCEIMNSWFDVMNSYPSNNNITHKQPYGQALETQEHLLNDVIEMAQNMICDGKKNMQVFQKGIVISTKSLMGLHTYLSEKYDIQCILTHRLNQDCLKNFFSQLRSKGGQQDNPSPLTVLQRVKTILLGKNPGIASAHSNADVSPEEEFLTSKALQKFSSDSADIEDIEDDLPSSSNDTTELPESSSATDGKKRKTVSTEPQVKKKLKETVDVIS